MKTKRHDNGDKSKNLQIHLIKNIVIEILSKQKTDKRFDIVPV